MAGYFFLCSFYVIFSFGKFFGISWRHKRFPFSIKNLRYSYPVHWQHFSNCLIPTNWLQYKTAIFCVRHYKCPADDLTAFSFLLFCWIEFCHKLSEFSHILLLMLVRDKNQSHLYYYTFYKDIFHTGNNIRHFRAVLCHGTVLVADQDKRLTKLPGWNNLNALLDKEADELVNARKYERSTDRQGYRSGHYKRNFQTTVGDVELKVPKLEGVPFSLLLRAIRWKL